MKLLTKQIHDQLTANGTARALAEDGRAGLRRTLWCQSIQARKCFTFLTRDRDTLPRREVGA